MSSWRLLVFIGLCFSFLCVCVCGVCVCFVCMVCVCVFVRVVSLFGVSLCLLALFPFFVVLCFFVIHKGFFFFLFCERPKCSLKEQQIVKALSLER